jgi:hypothetical protein
MDYRMKFATLDKRYHQGRKALSEKYGARELWSVIDHWSLYCGVVNLARCLAIADIVRDVLDVPGHIAEFGSFKGANLLFMAKLLRIFDPHGAKMIHCFDSFEGLTEFTAQDINHSEERGNFRGSLEELRDFIDLYEFQDEIVIHKGLIEETLPQVLAETPSLAFSMVYCDTDLYSATQTILKQMHPRLMKGGVFVFDEWNIDRYPGEGVAANEFMQEFGDYYQAESIMHTRQPTMLLRKIK